MTTDKVQSSASDSWSIGSKEHEARTYFARIHLYQDMLLNYALKKVKHESTAEELVQETFLAAISKKNQFKGESTLKTWLIGILKHKIVDHFRKSKKESKLFSNKLDIFEQEYKIDKHHIDEKNKYQLKCDPFIYVKERKFWGEIKIFIEYLSEREKLIFICREIKDQDLNDICAEMKITKNNLCVILFRIRKKLKRYLESKEMIQ